MNEDARWCRIDNAMGRQLQEALPLEEEIQDLAEFFRVFGDPTRIRILTLLSRKALCVHDIAALLEMQQTAISHQLKVLRHTRLVRYRKEGKMAIYSLDDEHIGQLTEIGFQHIREVHL